MKTIFRLIVLLGLMPFCFSCKKLVQQKEQDALVNIITSGNWYVEQYVEDTTNLTSIFLNYDFRFAKDGSVTGTRADSSVSGTWSGSIATRTINSNFPTANDPVKKLNGVWKITDSALDYVRAEMGTGASRRQLRLRKKP